MEPGRLIELAATISDAAAHIDEFLKSRNLPYPSFEPNAPLSLPEELGDARDAVLDGTSELYDLLVGQVEAFVAGSPGNMMSLNVIRRFDIANSFAPDEEMTFAQIAELTGLSEVTVRHVLRHAMTLRVFREPRKGVVAHTARSVLMRNTDRANFIAVSIEEISLASLLTAEAFARWPTSEEPNQTGFSLAHGTDRSAYEILQDDPARAVRFASAMSIFTSGKGYAASHVVHGYDWGSLGAGSVVDIGGSRGHIAVAIASQFPSLTFIVQDLPSTVAGAEAELPPEMARRVTFMAHDFFESQPIVADAYFLRWIFHNWSDKYCTKLLRALIPALRPGTRVIVNDICLPEPGSIALCKEKELRIMNLSMMSVFNARERDADEWRDLFHRADPRFRFVGIRQPQGSHLALIEVEWSGQG
ncbi:hypothetical protein EYZ11_012113 [Aspergillus tanneri]|uniref:O-methyltransferase C-terminal domain-containing protein n=1 Tax=Aspergillus tanneri TaxID=1220188 RepID=A0A4S3J6G3_9EURO|nr:hypothetical protein EYZ11_012113 [Aspergillus tanneri]